MRLRNPRKKPYELIEGIDGGHIAEHLEMSLLTRTVASPEARPASGPPSMGP